MAKGDGHNTSCSVAGESVIACALSAEPPRRLEPPAGKPACVVAKVEENHQSRRVIQFHLPITTDRLEIRLKTPSASVPAALFAVQCYGPV